MSFARIMSGPGLLIAGWLLVGLFSGMVDAQPAPAPGAGAEPSPVAPGDLTKPVFDTTKPVYDPIPATQKSDATMIAEVQGRAITIGDVGDQIRAMPAAMQQYPFETLYPSVVGHLIRLQAMVIRAQNQGMDEDPVVRRRVRAATDQVLADEYARRESEKGITEDALLARYKQEIEGKPGDEQVRVHLIMVPTEPEAVALIEQLKSGADFATLAHRSSKDTTAVTGGDLGFVTRDSLNAEIGAAAFSAIPGQIVPFPVRSIGSWFVVRVDERRRGPTPSFASVHEQLRQELIREASVKLASTVEVGFKIRRFDMLGHELSENNQQVTDKPDTRQ